MRWIQRRILGLLVLTACPAHDGAAPAEADLVPVVERPLVLLAGCSELGPDGVCVVGTRAVTLRVWIDQHEHGAVGVQVDGTPVEARSLGVDGGVRLELELPASARSLAIEGIDPRWRHGWELTLRHRPKPTEVAAADERAAAGDLAGAVTRLEAALEHVPDQERLAVLQRLQGFEYAREQLPAAARHAAQVVALARRLEQPRTAARAATAGVFIHAYRLGELAAARPFLDVLDELGPMLPEVAVWASFSHGLVARSVGDTTRALESFRESAQLAGRLGMPVDLLAAREGLGITYGELARGSEAVELARRMLADAEQPGMDCGVRYSALNTAGWVQLLLQQRQVEHLPPREFFERALALVEEGGECPIPDAEINVRINLALTALAEPDPAMALVWLEPISQVPPKYRGWFDEVTTRAGQSLGRWELVPSPLVRPDPSLPRAERWNALMSQAAVLEQLGLRGATIEAYARAEALVEASVSAIGVDLGRELFLSGRQASAQGLAAELVAAGRGPEALCHTRLARGRALRMLDRVARLGGASPEVRMAWEADVAAIAELRGSLDAEAAEDWGFSAAEQDRRRARRVERQARASRRLDRAYERLGATGGGAVDCGSLPGLGEGEVMLVPFPLDRGWLVFASDGATVVAHEVSEPPEPGERAAWAARALEPAGGMLQGARRLRILPIGRSGDVPFHALAWRDGLLLDVAPVTYALDLVHADAPSRPPGSALVVADPKQDLPLTRREAQRVAAALEDHAWTVERLEGRAVTLPRMEAALATVSLLHYAGHGEHGGAAGWGARLLMSEGQGFGVTDVLALPRAPRAVVLSGCETGRTTHDTLDGGMNLGRAFILAGSEWVIAVDRRVSDELSSAVGEGLYDELPEVEWDGPRALRRVQLRLRAHHPDWDWAAFRAVVR